MSDKIRLLSLSDSAFTCTGFASQNRDLMNYLMSTGDYEIIHMAHNYFGQEIKNAEFEDGLKLKFKTVGTDGSPYASNMWRPYIDKYKPELFFTLLDTFMLYQFYPNFNFAPAKTTFWYPTDGGQVLSENAEAKNIGSGLLQEGILPLGCEAVLQKCNFPVAMSKFGQRQILKVHGIKSHHIPHGVNTKIFYPTDKNVAKVKFGLQGKFVFGSVYRNQGRKMADKMFEAFALFAKDKNDVILFCHADPFDNAAVFNSVELIKKLRIQNKVVFSGMRFFNGFSVEQMREVYNAMDVFVLSTSGEGFGVPIIEAMSCGIPQIVTDFTTTHELLIEDSQTGLPAVCKDYLIGSWNVPRGIVDVYDMAEQMNKLYYDADLRKRLSDNSRRKAVEKYDFDNNVGKAWDSYIKEVILR